MSKVMIMDGMTLTVGGPTYDSNAKVVTIYSTQATNYLTASVSGQTLIATQDGVTSTFPVDDVNEIKFFGGSGGSTDTMVSANNVDINTSFQAGSNPANITVGGGNDTISGSAGNDYIKVEGTGDDVAYGYGGNDTLIGAGTGNYTLNGGTGNDSIQGGVGQDELLASSPGAKIVAGSSSNYGDFTPPVVTAPTTSTLAPVISAVSPTVIDAGEAVALTSSGSGLPSGATPLTATYSWNFGDTTSGSQYNTLTGWNASHVYNTPGTYIASLTITSPTGKTATAKITITVNSDNDLKVIYVAANGNDNNSGLSPSSPVQSLSRVESLLANNTEILFRDGDTFDMTSPTDGLSLNNLDNVIISSYGTGAQPKLLYTGSRTTEEMIVLSAGCTDVTIRGLTFDSIFNTDDNETGMPIAIWANGDDLNVLNNTFLNICYDVDCADPTGLNVQGNTSPLVTGLRAYMVWVQGQDISILGNYAANSTREHIVRVDGATDIEVAYNNLTNLDRASVDPSDIAKATLNIQFGSYAYVYDNTFTDGNVGVGPLNITADADDPEDQAENFQYAVFDSNTMNSLSLLLQPGASDIMVKNNLVNDTNLQAFEVEPFNTAYNRGVSDATFANNTVINNGIYGNFMEVYGQASDLTVENNLYVAPDLKIAYYQAASIYVQASNLDMFSLITGNVWALGDGYKYNPAAQMYIYPTWYDTSGLITPAEWNALPEVGTDYFVNVPVNSSGAYSSSSIAATVGSTVAGVLAYSDGVPRGGSTAVGAVQPS